MSLRAKTPSIAALSRGRNSIVYITDHKGNTNEVHLDEFKSLSDLVKDPNKVNVIYLNANIGHIAYNLHSLQCFQKPLLINLEILKPSDIPIIKKLLDSWKITYEFVSHHDAVERMRSLRENLAVVMDYTAFDSKLGEKWIEDENNKLRRNALYKEGAVNESAVSNELLNNPCVVIRVDWRSIIMRADWRNVKNRSFVVYPSIDEAYVLAKVGSDPYIQKILDIKCSIRSFRHYAFLKSQDITLRKYLEQLTHDPRQISRMKFDRIIDALKHRNIVALNKALSIKRDCTDFFGTTTGIKLFNKLIQTEPARNQLIYQLDQYITRIKTAVAQSEDKYAHGFMFFKCSRAINREANYRLAVALKTCLQDPTQTIQSIFTKVEEKRSAIIKTHKLNERTNYFASGINSCELNAIINNAKAMMTTSSCMNWKAMAALPHPSSVLH